MTSAPSDGYQNNDLERIQSFIKVLSIFLHEKWNLRIDRNPYFFANIAIWILPSAQEGILLEIHVKFLWSIRKF